MYKYLRLPADQVTQLELCTRFISLADVGNTNKEKYIYALSLSPVEKMRVLELIQKTTNEIQCPFVELDFTDVKLKGEMVRRYYKEQILFHFVKLQLQ